MIFILIDIGCSSNEILIYTFIYVTPSLICRANICSVGVFTTRSQAGSQNDPSFSDLLHITVKIHYQTTQIASSLHHTASLDIDKHDSHSMAVRLSLQEWRHSILLWSC